MKCTGEERKTCNTEKMGCEGCYYNKDIPEELPEKVLKKCDE